MNYEIKTEAPGEFFLSVYNYVGDKLQKMIDEHKDESIPEAQRFLWIKKEPYSIAFADYVFSYRRILFGVHIDIHLDEINIGCSREKRRDLFLKECKRFNIIPCIYKIEAKLENDSIDKPAKEIKALSEGWNLYNGLTGENVEPQLFRSDIPIKMSDWEVSDFLCQIAIEQLKEKKKDWHICSSCAIPEIYPQILFKDKNGKAGWILVRRIKNPDKFDINDYLPKSMRGPIMPRSCRYADGYLVTIGIISQEPITYDENGIEIDIGERAKGAADPLYRGVGFSVGIDKIRKIYDAELRPKKTLTPIGPRDYFKKEGLEHMKSSKTVLINGKPFPLNLLHTYVFKGPKDYFKSNEKITEQFLVLKSIQHAWQNLSTKPLNGIFAEDFSYNSAWVKETMHGEKRYLNYLSKKYKGMKETNFQPITKLLVLRKAIIPIQFPYGLMLINPEDETGNTILTIGFKSDLVFKMMMADPTWFEYEEL